MNKILIISIIGISLAGCTSYIPPGTNYSKNDILQTKEKRDADIFDCRIQATNAVPANTVVTTTPGYIYNGSGYGSKVTSTDANSPLRDNFFYRCLGDKGYSPNVTKLPYCKNKQVPSDYNNNNKIMYKPKSGSCAVFKPGQAFVDAVILRPEDQL